MTPERWRLVKAIVQAALARPAAGRPAFVAVACRGDTALSAEVHSLLTGPDTGEASDGFLASPRDAYVQRICAAREPIGAVAPRYAL